ncbi:MAG: hypothetical protein PHI34_03285 [Acidobacteriota bacterium]|nr:hypothetical protein [Acidobacteriota bacterium]
MILRPIPSAAGKAALVLLAILTAAACNPVENSSTSATMLVIENLTALDLTGLATNLCKSDVLFTDSSTGATSILADIGTATLSSQPLDPDPILGNSVYLDIQLVKISIVYTRSDGHNIEGVDVPYSFEAGISGTVRVGTLYTLTFTLVREAAKQEAPLVTLRGTGETIDVTAEITIYGKDLSGHSLKATGNVPITFGDFANE